jgi:hypothetical protein
MIYSISKLLCAGLILLSALFVTGCNSLPLNFALGTGIATGLGAMTPGHEIEQIYYLGSFDPQEQVPPALYRVRVRGQALLAGCGLGPDGFRLISLTH